MTPAIKARSRLYSTAVAPRRGLFTKPVRAEVTLDTLYFLFALIGLEKVSGTFSEDEIRGS
jgi:hypothetical protein